MARYQTTRRRLLKEVVCPHCWTAFAPEDVLWVAEELSLVGDDRLGDTERVRFLPTEYDEYGAPLDAKGYPCRDMACPKCHLKIPAPALDSPPLFMSIVGAPACGKSYYLASSTWSLRRLLPANFLVNFTDADPGMNHRLQEYESLQFLNEGKGLVKIEKTEEQGDLYDAIRIDGQTIVLPQPFVFLASAAANHPAADDPNSYSRMVCLYDNAGESYLPSNDLSSSPVTRHLAQSRCVFFLFDPTQDQRFRKEVVRRGGDAAAIEGSSPEIGRATLRQETVLAETIRRIRSLRHMTTNDRYENLFIVVVSKADVWAPLDPELKRLLSKDPISRTATSDAYGLRSDKIERASAVTRNLLAALTPEFVSAVENFAQDVLYVPVSATGVAPSFDDGSNTSGFRVEDMRPMWSAAPMLYALRRLASDLVKAGRVAKDDNTAPEPQPAPNSFDAHAAVNLDKRG